MATIQDVAKRAGVSIATVSRVLNGAPRVNEEIVARVNAAIQELRYRPNNAARTLRANRSAIIGLLISDIQNSFHTALVRSVEDIAHQNGYSVILCNSDEDPEKERRYVEVLIAEHVAGAIVMPTSERSRTFRMMHQRQIPVVAVDRRLRDDQADAVLVDNVRGSYDAVTHLIGNGYRNIGLITGPLGTTTGAERRDGYRKALVDAGIPLNPALERYGTFKEESGLQHATELFSGSEPIDALFITNNQMTIGALLAIQNLGLRVPDDVALVAFDEMPWANLNAISLTTISQPAYELGSTAALRLIQRMQGGVPWSRQEFVLTSTLHVRNSSRPRTSSGTTKRTVGARARH